MGDPPPLHVDTPALTWDPAVVTVPPMPVIPAGGDPMSLMISSIMPGLAADLTAEVAATHAREEQFAANLAGARGAYQSADQAGEQEIRTVSGGQLAATDTATSGLRDTGSSGGQFLNTATQMAGQAPQQLMGMAAAAPSSIMQGAMAQVSQLSGQFGKSADGGQHVEGVIGQGSEYEATEHDQGEESEAPPTDQDIDPDSSPANRMPENEADLGDPDSRNPGAPHGQTAQLDL